MTGYDEFKRIMSEINRKIELEKISKGDTNNLDFLKNLFGI